MNRLVLVPKWGVCSINCASNKILIWLKKPKNGASISSLRCPYASMNQLILIKTKQWRSEVAFGSLFFTSRAPYFQEKKSVRHQTAAKKHLYRQKCAGTFLSLKLSSALLKSPGALRLANLLKAMYDATLSPKSNHLNRWLDNLRKRKCS